MVGLCTCLSVHPPAAISLSVSPAVPSHTSSAPRWWAPRLAHSLCVPGARPSAQHSAGIQSRHATDGVNNRPPPEPRPDWVACPSPPGPAPPCCRAVISSGHRLCVQAGQPPVNGTVGGDGRVTGPRDPPSSSADPFPATSPGVCQTAMPSSAHA